MAPMMARIAERPIMERGMFIALTPYHGTEFMIAA